MVVCAVEWLTVLTWLRLLRSLELPDAISCRRGSLPAQRRMRVCTGECACGPSGEPRLEAIGMTDAFDHYSFGIGLKRLI